MRPWLLALSLTLVPAPTWGQSQVPSVRDVIELSKAGLGDEVLLALIEVNGSVYPSDPATLKSLKAAGVSPVVIVAMVKSGRQPQPAPLAALDAPEPTAPEPQVVIVERPAAEPQVREVIVPIPVYVAVPTYRSHVPRHVKPAEPVYWGFGGKLRPDAWRPTVVDIQKDARVPEAQRK